MGRPTAATTDGKSVLLPPHMPRGVSREEAIARYRLLAIEQAERIMRGTAARVPADDALVRDLYLLREAGQVDQAIASANAGLVHALEAARRDALATRPSLQRMTPIEQAVEGLTRDALLNGAPAAPSTPEASVRWAQETAASLRALPGRYRGVPAVDLWGTHHAPKSARQGDARDAKQASGSSANAIALPVGDAQSAIDSPLDDNANVGVTSSPDDNSSDIEPENLPQLPSNADQSGAHDAMLQDRKSVV